MADFLKLDFANNKIAHGFFKRNGGVSAGLYQSLNCSYGSADEAKNVTENRKLVMAALRAGSNAVIPPIYQYHSAECVLAVKNGWSREAMPKADALATDLPNVVLSVLTADCGPVLFYGQKNNGTPVIAAAHAGWGGALKGVLEASISKMQSLGAELNSIEAAIGPCIAQASYEVGAEFKKPFITRDATAAQFFSNNAKTGKDHFSLEGYIEFRLQQAGIKKILKAGVDTYINEPDYFSYRRATHKNEPDYGRQISAVMIRT